MSMRIRLGPMSVSSRGRVGVHAGPVSVYGGGRRRKSGSESGWVVLGVCVMVLVAVYYAVLYLVMWPLSLWGHAIHLTTSFGQLRHQDHYWKHQHYPLLGLRYVGAAVLLLTTIVLAVYVLHLLTGPRRSHPSGGEPPTPSSSPRGRGPSGSSPTAAIRTEFARNRSRTQFPARFTQTWIETHVPNLEPAEMRAVMSELRRRGWTEDDLRDRVEPYVKLAFEVP